MSFNGKVVVVTGGSSGLGAAIAIAFAKEGAHVAIVGRNEERLREIAKKCNDYSKNPLVIKADLNKDDDAEKVITDTINKFTKLDVLINCAGILRRCTLEGGFMRTFDEIMRINLRAAVVITELATPYIIASKGNIINISSVGSTEIPNAEYTANCVSKAGLDHFTRGAAIELSKYGVRVNAISPGPVKTKIFANAGIHLPYEEIGFRTLLNRWGEPEEIADLALFMASDKAKSVTGSIYTSDNGYLLVKY
ncbi:3-oxoacyl-[acyl-carrier-protein] reductase FabG-like [Zerene cesonia]|uniref:3-oxoacyl-[acyl-carrier-protein] reductase FabG-like n=1 Tax=Zerene cesonia TaxID=33412 RepID=UPI0018E57477|nr:3-oxoacyl-[acyl-carrier-protein] reductase FabG-like [Zerene cesonia]